MTREDFDRAMRLHFWAPYELVSQIVPEMRTWGGGRIVNISSIGGKVAVPHLAPYSVSKFALTGFSDAIRTELAARQHPCHHRRARNDAHRLARECEIQRQTRHRICLVFSFSGRAADLHERRSRREKNPCRMSSRSAIAHTHICRARGHSRERALSKSHWLHDEACQSIPSWSGRRGRQRIAGWRASAPPDTKMADAPRRIGRHRKTTKREASRCSHNRLSRSDFIERWTFGVGRGRFLL